MYKILVKFKPCDNELEYSSFEELVSLNNYNDIKMLSIEGNPDNYYLVNDAFEFELTIDELNEFLELR